MPSRHAFSLIEVMVVVCLCALVAGLSMIQLSFLDSTIVHTEIDKLASMCGYAQQLACATNQEKYVTFDTTTNEYWCDGYREKLSGRVQFGCLPGIKGPPGDATHTIEKPITFPGKRICFYPTGVISSGTVYIRDKKGSSHYALSNAVSQVSYLRMYKHNGSWKLLGQERST